MNYVDKFGLYNVRPVQEDGLPSGNDGFILTAYALKLGLAVDQNKVKELFSSLPKIAGSTIPLRRLPYKETPFLSRDVILGLHMLGLVTTADLQANHWSFSPFASEAFRPILALNQFWRLRKEDRNYFWQHEFKQVYRFAFSVPLNDRAYLLRTSGLKVPFLYRAFEKFSRLLKTNHPSSQLIEWSKGLTKARPEVFLKYFGPDHPFTKSVIRGD